MVEGSPNFFFKKEKRTEINNLSPLCPTDFLELSTALHAGKKEEFSIKKNSSKKDSAIFMKKIKSPKSPSVELRSRLLKRLLLLHIPVLYIFHPTYIRSYIRWVAEGTKLARFYHKIPYARHYNPRLVYILPHF